MLGNYEPSSTLLLKCPRLDDVATASSSVTIASMDPHIQGVSEDAAIPFAKHHRHDSTTGQLSVIHSILPAAMPQPIPNVDEAPILF
jgi:hypothetical protein